MVEIEKATSSEFCFTLKAESGNSLLKSICYSNKEMAEEAINSLLHLNRNAFERKTNASGKFLFCLKNRNGNLIGTSALYSSEAGMENGIKNLTNRIHSLSSLNQL